MVYLLMRCTRYVHQPSLRLWLLSFGNFFIKGLIIGSSGSFCYVMETVVDGMFDLLISHIQKFAWPFYKYIILSDIVRCSHIKKKKKLRRAKNSVLFNPLALEMDI